MRLSAVSVHEGKIHMSQRIQPSSFWSISEIPSVLIDGTELRSKMYSFPFHFMHFSILVAFPLNSFLSSYSCCLWVTLSGKLLIFTLSTVLMIEKNSVL